ncbi:MAG: hypothetical protein L6R39_003879 [Caloplaca ligustica]|nr:MAG: hypothetical protein L6R39_003879 [Caloplaca ligustica]
MIKQKLQHLLPRRTQHEKIDEIPIPAVETQNPSGPTWTLVHGFYALMGGFAFSTAARANEDFLPSQHTRCTITPEGIPFLLDHEPDALPYISEDQIKDKSKADGLKKTLVCAQALWFCVQCITRLAQALPVGLLELNTFAHALCTLVIYVLWWHKPLDVEEPTEVNDPRLHPILAYMWMTSMVSAKDHLGPDIGGLLRDEMDCIWPFENPVPGDLILQARTPEATDLANFPSRPDPSPGPVCTEVSYPQRGKTRVPGRHNYDWRRYASSTYTLTRVFESLHLVPKSLFRRPPGIFVRNTAIDHLSPSDLLRWRLAHTAIERYDLELDLRIRHTTPVNGRRLQSRVTLRQWNVSLNLQSLHLAIAVAVSGALYGGLHLLAWDVAFPSSVEQLLWRISACCVTLNGVVIGCIGRLSTSAAAQKAYIAVDDRRSRHSLSQERPSFWTGVRFHMKVIIYAVVLFLTIVPLPLLWFSYVLARIYLVVESLRSLAYLPPGAFLTPTWPAYFPHIS